MHCTNAHVDCNHLLIVVYHTRLTASLFCMALCEQQILLDVTAAPQGWCQPVLQSNTASLSEQCCCTNALQLTRVQEQSLIASAVFITICRLSPESSCRRCHGAIKQPTHANLDLQALYRLSLHTYPLTA